MNKRIFSLNLFLFFFCSSLAFAAPEDRKPNILFILTDDQRWDTLGCYGNSIIKTPNLDKLAAQGARLDAFYPAQPLCCPSRASYLTGLYPHQTGIKSNQKMIDIPAGTKTVAHYLNAAGYKTGFIGKAHLGGDPGKWGFQDYPVVVKGSVKQKVKLKVPDKREKLAEYLTAAFADAAIDFIQSNKSQPWFLWLATTAPHWPFLEDLKYAYDPSKLKPPPGWPLPFKFRTEKWSGYYATITMLDTEVGRVLAKLDQLGLTDQTFVLMTSDNGFMFGSHGVKHKDSFFEGSARVPGIARWPVHIKNEIKIASLFSSVDLLPTLLELAGAVSPRNLTGLSMLPALTTGKPLRTELFSESLRWTMLRKGPWKYVKQENREFLFNIQDDPFESQDQMKQNKIVPAVVPELRKVMARWLEQTPEIAGAHKAEKDDANPKKSKQEESDD
jgi:arylsulfatase A-like enzyme